MKYILLAVPSFVDYPKSQNVTYSNDIILSCNGTGKPLPNIIWIKDGRILNNITSRYLILNQRKRLLIKNSTTYDRGLYQCMLKNDVAQIVSPAAIVDIYSKTTLSL